MRLIIKFPIIIYQALPGNWKISSHHSLIEDRASNLYLHKQSRHLRNFWLCRKHLLIANNDVWLDPNALWCQFFVPSFINFCVWNKSFKFNNNLLESLTVLVYFWPDSVNSVKFWLFYIDIQTVLDITFNFWLTLFFGFILLHFKITKS